MLRAKRRHRKNYNTPGDAHMLTFCCHCNYQFLGKDRTCQWLAESIEQARRDRAFALWAYVFMPEHVHLLIWPRELNYDIASIREAIKEPVGRRAIEYLREHSQDWFNRVTRQRGGTIEHLFWKSGGGFDRNIWNPRVLQYEVDYLHRNPVRRGLVSKPEDWKWSSASWYLKNVPGPIPIDPIPVDWADLVFGA